MPRCPNCGRETARTEDWACQWCGYPLPRGSYKVIPMTYKQLREEMLYGAVSEEEPGQEEPEPPPPPIFKKAPRSKRAPEPEPPAKPISRQSPGPEGASGSELTKWVEFKESLRQRKSGPEFPVRSPSKPAPRPQHVPYPAQERQHVPQPEPVAPPRPVSQPPPQYAPPQQPAAPPVSPQYAPPQQPAAPPVPPQYVPQQPVIMLPQQPQYVPQSEPVAPLQLVSQPLPQYAPQPPVITPAPQPQYAPQPQPVVPPAQPQYTPPPAPPAYVVPAPQPPPLPRSILTGTLPDVVDVTVEELNLAYITDAPATDARLAGKTLRVTGVVERVVVKELFDIQYVLLAGAARQTWNVRCSFDKANARDLERVTEGQTSTVQGKFDGRQKNIILNNCALVR